MSTTNTNKIAMLFPGQGSQYVGMGREFVESDPAARALMEQAEEISGFPLAALCFDGPMAELTRTLHLQPAVTVVNLICWQALAAAGVVADYVAGHSLGEYSALCAAGVLDPAATLRLVCERGRLMEREATANPGGMQAVLGLGLEQVEAIAAAVEQGVVVVANYNSAAQIVLSGDAQGLAAAAPLVAEHGGKAIPLKVSGAWHSPLVAGAVADFTAAIERENFVAPTVPILMNVSGESVAEPAAIRRLLARQIASMVRWYEIINGLLAAEVRVFIEVGPKNVLSGLLKKIVPPEYSYTVLQVDTPAKLAACCEALQGEGK